MDLNIQGWDVFQMLDDTGRVIGWWDSSHSNHWMTYVRSTTKLSDYNVFAVQKENKVNNFAIFINKTLVFNIPNVCISGLMPRVK